MGDLLVAAKGISHRFGQGLPRYVIVGGTEAANLAVGDNCQHRENDVKSAETGLLVGYVGAALLGASGAYLTFRY